MKKSGGAPAWMITFADLMALLLTMFVLLLSFSSMDAQRYQVIANAMEEAFGLSAIMNLGGMLDVGVSYREGSPLVPDIPVVRIEIPEKPPLEKPEKPKPDEPEMPAPEIVTAPPQGSANFAPLVEALKDEVGRGIVRIEEKSGSTLIRFPDRVAFPSGSDQLTAEFLAMLDKLAAAFAKVEGDIVVAGHTDNRPIAAGRFRSNWDLSSARAASVVHYLLNHTTIDPARMTAQGFSDSRPLAPNTTPENRAANRRVEISVLD
ncbi:MAG: OmpA family protein [Rhodospirillales bacterium]|nr:OmpA family protein [Rhodospirillales bacterium]